MFVVRVFKDLGDAFSHEFAPVPTWLCYDLGRVLPGGAEAPIVRNISKIEDDLVERYPQYF
jgi:hypothetical protein